jgi:indolepyruvate ferredoxin oxidoreductase beta subunit
VIEKGGADILVSCEPMEALRWLRYLRPEGKVIVNNYRINPMPVVSGAASYPDGVPEELQELADATVVDAASAALELGNSRVMNIILLGATVELMGLSAIDWAAIVRENVKPAFVELNLKALAVGRGMIAG